MNIVQKINFLNSKKHSVLLIVEPWAEEYSIPHGKTVQIVAKSMVDGFFEIEISDDYLIIYGWNDSVVNVMCDGVELTPFT